MRPDYAPNLEVNDYTYKYDEQNDYTGTVICSYIVKSNIDNSYIWDRQKYSTRLPDF
jgi:hypothetical protein